MVDNQARQHHGLKIYLISYEIGSCHNSCRFYHEKQVPCMPALSDHHLADCATSSFCSWWSHNHLLHHAIGKDSPPQLPTFHGSSETQLVAFEIQVATEVLSLCTVHSVNKRDSKFLPKFCF